jgi:electron transport complex protein RnfG
MIKYITKNGVLLALFALITTGLISLTFWGTKGKIDAQKQRRLLSILTEVVPPQYYNNTLYEDCTLVTDPRLGNQEPHRVYRARLDGKPTALAIETTAPNGYSGQIQLVVGVQVNGQIIGVRAIDHKETPGLGDKIELSVSDWVLSFAGKSYSEDTKNQWMVKKDGGQFDQFTGATITPRAVVGSLANTLDFIQAEGLNLFDLPPNCVAIEETNE